MVMFIDDDVFDCSQLSYHMLYQRGSDCFHYAVFDRLHLERADLLKLIYLHLKFLKFVKSAEWA